MTPDRQAAIFVGSTTQARRRISPRVWAIVMLAPLAVGLLIFAVYPMVYLIGLSVTKSTLGEPFRAFVGLGNYSWLASRWDYPAALLRTLLFALPVAMLQMVLGVALAVILIDLRRNSLMIRSLILLPLMTPPVLVGVAWKLILAPAGGLLNGVLQRWGICDGPVSFLGSEPWATLSLFVADTWQWTPFVAILAYAALLQVPSEVREAAQIDGARPSVIFWRIVLPIAAPGLIAVLLLRVIMAFKTFDLVYILTFGGPGYATSYANFVIWQSGLQKFDVGTAAAQTVLFAAFVSLVTMPIFWLHKYSERHQ